MPGTAPSTVNATFVMPSPGWNDTVEDVCSSSGGVPPCASAWESAIEKHAACAAAISSSGLVAPLCASSERAGQLIFCSPIAPLVVFVIVPLPSMRLPFHVTFALRSVAIFPRSFLLRHYFDALRLGARAPFLELQNFPQRSNRDLELVERWLARRQPLQPHAGGKQHHQDAVVLMLAGETDELVGEAG